MYASDVLERGEKEKKLSVRAHEDIKRTMTGAAVDWEPMVLCGDPVEKIKIMEASVRKWNRIIAGKGTDGGVLDCPPCRIF